MIETEKTASVLVRVWLLGPFRMERKRADETWETIEKTAWEHTYARSLLKRLLCAHKRRAMRSDLMDDLWPERSISLAEKYLNNAASRLYKVFEHDHVFWSIGAQGRHGYELADQSHLWTDSDECEALLREAEQPGRTSLAALPLLERASKHFERGSVLEDEEGQWCIAVRAEKEAMMRCCCIWLAEAYEAQGMLWRARTQYRKLLEINPFDEDIVCRLMATLYRHGMVSDALSFYQEAKRRFKAEGLPLSQTTKQLAEKLASEPLPPEMYLSLQLQAPQSHPSEQLLIQSSLPNVTQDIIGDRNIHQRSEQGIAHADAINTLLDLLANTALQEQPMRDQERQETNETRRQILMQLLEAAGITLISPTLATVASTSSPIAVEEFILQCASSLKACWYLLKGKGLSITEELLSAYVPSLTRHIQQSSRHLETLTGLAAQAKILQAVLVMHKLDFLGREMYCHEAVTYGQFSGEKRLHAGALMYLAYTYTYCPPRQPEKAIRFFLEGLRTLGDEPSILRGDIYNGLADAYAQCQAEQEALETIELAHMHFPDHPELDPSFLYADYGQSEIYQWQGKMYLDLAVHYPDRRYAQKAFDAFSHSIKLQSVAERNTTETIIHQADAARGIGDLDRYVVLLTEGTHMARSLGSQNFYSEAFDIFQRTPIQWRNESAIQELAKEVFREPPL